MARCNAVQQWDEEAFQKAQKWANYFEEVHLRLKGRPALAEKLDKYLENFNQSGQIYLGSLKLSHEVLGKSKSWLRKFLLQNPYLSKCQYEWLLKLYGVTEGETQDCIKNEDLMRDAVHLSRTKATFQLLCKMRARLNKDMIRSQDNTSNPDTLNVTSIVTSKSQELDVAVDPEEVCISITGDCLFKHVEHKLKFGDLCKNRVTLSDKLEVLAKQENGLRSILTALLYACNDSNYVQQSHQVTQFILDWLTEFLTCSKPHSLLMSLPPHLLCRLSFMYDAFSKLYLSQLLCWADKMAPSISASESDCLTVRGVQWRFMVCSTESRDSRAIDENHLSFSNLLNHFDHVLNGPDSIADPMKKEMHSRWVKNFVAGTPLCDDSLNSKLKLKLNVWEDISGFFPHLILPSS